MSHFHHSHCKQQHSNSVPQRVNLAFYIGIGVNLLYTAIEYIVGFHTNSLALISDASHNLSDVASLVISLIGLNLAQKSATALYTYGYKKASILASLINAILLVSITLKIILESIERLTSSPDLPGTVIMFTAAVGIVINAVSALFFYQDQKTDINLKGAFLHLIVDALVSVGVVFSGWIIHLTNWAPADPLISLVIAFVILFSTWSLLSESTKLLLDGVPKQINTSDIERTLLQVPSVASVHHIHVWALSSSQNALTAHIVLQIGQKLTDFQRDRQTLKLLLTKKNIHHSTFEIEEFETECTDTTCS